MKIDVEEIRRIAPPNKVIAFVMHECGATYEEIGQYLGVTRQAAHATIKAMKAE